MPADSVIDDVHSRLNSLPGKTELWRKFKEIWEAINKEYNIRRIVGPRGDRKIVCHIGVSGSGSNDGTIEMQGRQLYVKFAHEHLLEQADLMLTTDGPGTKGWWSSLVIPDGGDVGKAISILRYYALRINPKLKDSLEQSRKSGQTSLTPPASIVERQGFIGDPIERMAIDRRAMEYAMECYSNENPVDCHSTKSYDIRIMRNQCEYYVEVKGTKNQRADRIILTAGEVKHVQDNPGMCILFIVENIVYDGSGVASGGIGREIFPFLVDQDMLSPIHYYYDMADF